MHRWKYVIRLFDMKLREEVVNGLEPCSLKYTGIFYICISVKMCQCSKFGCFPGYNHAYKIWGKPVECRPVLSQLTNSWRGTWIGRQKYPEGINTCNCTLEKNPQTCFSFL